MEKSPSELFASNLTIDEDIVLNMLAESILNNSLSELGIVEMNKPLAERMGIPYQRLKWHVYKIRKFYGTK